MAQTVLVITKVGDQELHVGKCSHAQARILSKKGHGRIEGSKLFVNLRPVHLHVATNVTQEPDPNVSQAELDRRLEWLTSIVQATVHAETKVGPEDITASILASRGSTRLNFPGILRSPSWKPREPSAEDLLFFDETGSDLVFDDPQLNELWDTPSESSLGRFESLFGKLTDHSRVATIMSEEEREVVKKHETQILEGAKVVYTFPSARKTFHFFLNGTRTELDCDHATITYKKLCLLAGEEWALPNFSPGGWETCNSLTVTYANAKGGASGVLQPGGTVLLQEGDVVRISNTGSA
jgi:hypothetical protein